MKAKSKTLYYAVSRRGQGNIYTEKPEREEHFGIWAGHIEGCYQSVVSDMECEGVVELPDIRWEDDPVELKLTITNG